MDKFSINGVLKRYSGNPIITADDVPYSCAYVYNSGAVKYKGKYFLLLRVDPPDQTSLCLGLAVSEDGYNFKIKKEPVMVSTHFENGKIYDPRITQIGDTFYICYAVSTMEGVRQAIASTKDFEYFDRISLSLPDNRNGALFPEKFGEYYVRLERPFPLYNNVGYSNLSIWISYSPDLVFWGKHQLVLGAKDVPWGTHKIGPGAPPIKTDQGWLEIFHAVELTSAGEKIYRLGCMLLELENPAKIKGVAKGYILEPEEEFEKTGYVNNVVFTCGAICEDNGEVKVYYGAADERMCVATANIDELVSLCN